MFSRKILLTVAFDGTDFHGWQCQTGMRTVQGELEAVLRRVLKHPVHAHGASRTDAGVHALRQMATLPTSAPIPARNLGRAINQRLPNDMAIVASREVPFAFDVSRHAIAKLYRYRIMTGEMQPVALRPGRFAWHIRSALDLDLMREAARRMCGTRDFKGFASQGSPRATTVRTVSNVSVRKRFAEYQVDVIGDGFLYNQVRNMVGTLVEIGRGHWPVERVDEILASCDRALAGRTAPACGLCLQWVKYASLPEFIDVA